MYFLSFLAVSAPNHPSSKRPHTNSDCLYAEYHNSGDELISPEQKAEIEKIRASTATKARDIIRNVMPRKVISLSELITVRLSS